MPLHYSDKRQAITNVGHELHRRGWKLWGYHEDQSDSMTDYYAPASWDGVATHPEYPGVVAGVDVNTYIVNTRSGKPEKKSITVEGATCDRCHGDGSDPSGWTLETARQDPVRYHREINILKGMPGAIALFPEVISPIPFLSGGALRCVKCSGRGHALNWETIALPDWPEFQTTPRGKMWHVEHAGQIIASGTGFGACAGYVDHNPDAKLAVKSVADKIEAAARRTMAPAVPTATPTATDDTGSLDAPACIVEQERDWTWISFTTRPAEDVLAALRSIGARWSKRRQAWYITQPVAGEDIRRSFAA